MKNAFPTAAAIFLLSGAALAYEVILVRLLAMTRFHHLAFMVLSLALLGSGLSGVVLAYGRRRFKPHFNAWFSLFALLFATGTVVCFQLSQRIAIHPDQWLWSPAQTGRLAALYLILSLPFLCAAAAVGLAYWAADREAAFIYRADMLGAGIGALTALAALWLPQAQGLWVPWCAGLTAAAAMVWPIRKKVALILCAAALAGPTFNFKPAVELILSKDKPLSIALSAEGAQAVTDLFGPLGRITVVRNSLAPYRHAPGLSLTYDGQVAEQWAAFVDGDTFEALPVKKAPTYALRHLDYLPQALEWRLLPHRPRVLLLETIGVEQVLRAVMLEAARIDLVTPNPNWRKLMQISTMAPVTEIFDKPPLRLISGAPRGFLKTGNQDYDLIFLGSPGRSALQADQLHTVEGVANALGRLASDGILSAGGISELPPRTALRLLATTAAALRKIGIADPAGHLAMIRSLQTVHLIAKKKPLSLEEIAAIRAFCEERHFDPVWFPTMTEAEADRWNQIGSPVFYEAALSLLGSGAAGFFKNYKFDVSPAVDDRPGFTRFLKFKTAVELIGLRGSGALGQLSLAEPVLGATLFMALLLAAGLVWLPLRRYRARKKAAPPGAVFLLLGSGFMLVEWAVLEKLSLFLNEPVVAVTVTLAAFLIMAGVGGGLSSRWLRGGRLEIKLAGWGALCVGSLAILYGIFLPHLLAALPTLPVIARGCLAMVLVSPLALCLGLPFPVTVAAIKRIEPQSLPWAWGLNGCGALIGPILGFSLALYYGVSSVIWAAAGCYLIVGLLSFSAARAN